VVYEIELMVDFRVLGGCRGSIGRVLDISFVQLSTLRSLNKISMND
jgi:hypothetical protein